MDHKVVGMRDVRDYKYAAGGSDRLNTSSPFNIKVQSFTLRNFNQDEVGRLYAQHTAPFLTFGGNMGNLYSKARPIQKLRPI